MKFTKMHGAGNDYVYVNGFDYKSDWSKLSEFVSDRHTGIRSDGLIVALPSITGLEAKAPKFPRPSMAVPLLITATKFPLVV